MDETYRIVVLHRGWVVVGRVLKTDTEVLIEDGAVIRRWGTTKGLPELVTGPTKETVLDKASGAIRAHPLAIVLELDVQAEAWRKALA